MTCHIQLLTPSGLRPVAWQGESLADTARFEPSDGVYTITNTHDTTQVVKWDAHLDRLVDSARRANIDLVLDRERLRASLRGMILTANWGDVRFRITVGSQQPDTLILSIEPFHPLPARLINEGARAITAANSARHNPQAKTTDWPIQRQALQAAMPEGIYDTFLLDKGGYLLEGLGSNVYMVLNDTLYTAGEGVLKGISQQIILDIAPAILPVQLEALHISQLKRVQEAFLSSSSRGIVPVVEIDGMAIGNGQVGEKTKALRRACTDWQTQHLEEL